LVAPSAGDVSLREGETVLSPHEYRSRVGCSRRMHRFTANCPALEKPALFALVHEAENFR
jgi:hypothetical protein